MRDILFLENSFIYLLEVTLIKIVIWCLITILVFSWLLHFLVTMLLQFLKYIFLWVLIQNTFIVSLLGWRSLLCQFCFFNICTLDDFAHFFLLNLEFAFFLVLQFELINLINLFLRKIVYHVLFIFLIALVVFIMNSLGFPLVLETSWCILIFLLLNWKNRLYLNLLFGLGLSIVCNKLCHPIVSSEFSFKI